MKKDWHLIALLSVSFCLLFLFLDWKPPQHDEGVNGWFIDDIQHTGFYEYSADAYHGPLHYYLLYFFNLLFGRSHFALRLSAVLFGFFGVFLITRLRPYVGKRTAYAAAFLAAVSPGMVFYSRYAIHESGLFFFAVLTLLGHFRLGAERDRKALWIFGSGVTGMILMKETWIIMVSALFFAAVLQTAFEKFSPYGGAGAAFQGLSRPPRLFKWRDVFEVTAVCLAVLVVFYSGFFLNWKGMVNLGGSFSAWIINGVSESEGQRGFWKPFGYWLTLFARYEWQCLIGLLALYPVWLKGSRAQRFLAAYAAGCLLAYSVIPYKTPWCVMQIIWPLLLVMASGFALMMENRKRLRMLAYLLFVGLGAWSLVSTVRLNFFHYTDDKEPYVNIQTYPEVIRMTDMIRDAAQRDPRKRHMPIQIVMKAYWPLSWLLGDFSKVSYHAKTLPLFADGAVIFVENKRKAAVELRMNKNYYIKTFRLNPVHEGETAYFDPEIFSGYFDEASPMFRPVPREKPLPGQGWDARWYRNAEWKGDPFRVDRITDIDLAWASANRPAAAPLSILLTGQLYVPEPGTVKFFLSSDDGSEFRIDGRPLIDHLGKHGEEIKEAKLYLKTGWHSVELRFNDFGGSAALRLWWQLPGREQEKIPAQYLHPGTKI